MKKISTIFLTSIFIYANSTICYEIPKNIKVSKEEIKIYKNSITNGDILSDKTIKETILKNRLFSKAFLNRYKIDKKTKTLLNISIENALSNLYIEKLKQFNKPNDKVLKSFYLDHKDEFKPIEKVSISTIKVNSLKKADKIYLKLKQNPKLFEELAKRENLDPQIHYKDISILRFNPIVREWIRNHKKGDISEPIKIGNSFFIDRIDNKTKTNISYNSLKEDIKNLLMSIYVNSMIKKEFEKLKKSEGIK